MDLMDLAPLTDRENAARLLDGLLRAVEAHEDELRWLEIVVAKAQNGPPLGDGDGTLKDGNCGPVTNQEWTAARDAAHAFRLAMSFARKVVDPR
jgi:hypothetical protein